MAHVEIVSEGPKYCPMHVYIDGFEIENITEMSTSQVAGELAELSLKIKVNSYSIKYENAKM